MASDITQGFVDGGRSVWALFLACMGLLLVAALAIALPLAVTFDELDNLKI